MLILRKDETGVTVKLSQEEYKSFIQLMNYVKDSKVNLKVTKEYPVGMVGKWNHITQDPTRNGNKEKSHHCIHKEMNEWKSIQEIWKSSQSLVSFILY